MTYAELTLIYDNLGAASKYIKDVVQKDYDEILDLQSGGLNYPALLIESPAVEFRGDDDSVQEIWSSSIVVIWSEKDGNADSIRWAREHTYRIAEKLLGKLIQENTLLHTGLSSKRILPIDPYTADPVVGWRIALEHESLYSSSECYDPNDWDDTVPNEIHRFAWVDNSSGSIDIDVAVIVPGADSVSVVYSIDNGSSSSLTLTGGQGNITGSGDFVYIEMTAVYGSHERVATAFIRPGELASGISIPFKYNEYD